ncbi:hypothetical protein CKO11_15410 [Rhodobacter sp. TJ_12]|nr:hypothetical protein [Rhodobacter sp. TJ_12]
MGGLFLLGRWGHQTKAFRFGLAEATRRGRCPRTPGIFFKVEGKPGVQTPTVRQESAAMAQGSWGSGGKAPGGSPRASGAKDAD